MVMPNSRTLGTLCLIKSYDNSRVVDCIEKMRCTGLLLTVTR